MVTQVFEDVDATGVDRAVPARCTLATRDGQLSGAELRVYQFHSDQTLVPPLRDIAVIAWQTPTQIALKCGAIRNKAIMSPGDFSILRPGFESSWQWNRGFQATVLYLNERRLADFASEVFDRHVDSVSVHESFQVQDPVILHGITALATELRRDAVGGALCRDALMTQLSVQLLRHHAEPRLRAPRCPGALSAFQAREVADYIETNLAADLSLDSLARVAGISQYHFARLFKRRFEISPHAYVQRRRAERARHLILHSDMELKAIVGATGFCDQSHMTKSFKRVFGVTPAEFRRSG
ncbi:AraC family transcriptional regulator [Mycobacterium sp. CVI_P3]|uniref:AraC family transcriptional regulator n=1 Tax=Mycobacterium pinniadriaticum TaxID=2994102 RepID=A0ABT3SHL5_9MYCO|nr:AraC family transcriptional regulator [Mycobacterium pinniadriaticum]MCX2932539.1 AraC family transcriptional regulator [Mycobacterium pinniadriaticum]MCX2939017.1 AraC family transcriptional regulator [Mycobacterium pinniadriaticum]